MKTLNQLQLAKELIRFPSITPVDAGIMKFLEKKLKRLGFKTKTLEFKERGFKPVKNLYARFGNKSPNFCYAGHLDVVPPGNIKDWTTNPFKPSVKKGHLIGRGANDMKSSIAAFVSAVSTFLSKNKKYDCIVNANSVLLAISFRTISPIQMALIFLFSSNLFVWVPFPDPGAPKIIIKFLFDIFIKNHIVVIKQHYRLV